MKKIILSAVLVCFFVQTQAQSEVNSLNRELINNIILINSSPWQVLMDSQGDILSKLSQKQRYLEGYEQDFYILQNQDREDSNFVSQDYSGEVASPTSFQEVKNKVFLAESERDLEVNFKKGSATIIESDIRVLNIIAKDLQNNPSKKFKVFSFNNEPVNRYYILSQRRLDAVLKYLSIRGVDTQSQLILVNSSVRGQSNKIVFFAVD